MSLRTWSEWGLWTMRGRFGSTKRQAFETGPLGEMSRAQEGDALVGPRARLFLRSSFCEWPLHNDKGAHHCYFSAYASIDMYTTSRRGHRQRHQQLDELEAIRRGPHSSKAFYPLEQVGGGKWFRNGKRGGTGRRPRVHESNELGRTHVARLILLAFFPGEKRNPLGVGKEAGGETC